MSLPEELTLASGPTAAPIVHPFEFSGRGGEYFRIWIVNLALTLITLGIYGPWAKVRTKRYFYGHMQVAGHRFAYHAEPIRILYGRVLALLIMAVIYGLNALTPALTPYTGLVILLLVPEAVRRSLIFRARNTSWRGVRFGFASSWFNAAVHYVLLPITFAFSLGLSIPWVIWLQRRWYAQNHRYGTTPFETDFSVGEFYILAARTVLTYAVVGVGLSLVGWLVYVSFPMAGMSTAPLTPLILAATAFIAIGVWIAGDQNILFEGTTIAGNHFESEVSGLRLGWIYASNAVAVAFTLGLFLPWASIRIARYRAECLALVQTGELDTFIGAQLDEQDAVGEELGGILDIEVGF